MLALPDDYIAFQVIFNIPQSNLLCCFARHRSEIQQLVLTSHKSHAPLSIPRTQESPQNTMVSADILNCVMQ